MRPYADINGDFHCPECGAVIEYGRTLTGAWIETPSPVIAKTPATSHPHGVRRMNSAVVFNDVCMVREVIILINGFKWLFI